MSDRICTACGGFLRAWKGAYERCAICSSLEVVDSLVPTAEENLSRYTSTEYHAHGRERGSLYHSDRLRHLQKRCPDGATLLEIGCGTGEFAQAAMHSGFQVTAIEPGSLYQSARYRIGDAARQASWERFLPGVAGAFDAVVAWEVVEHLTNPRQFLAASAAAVKPGGILALSTPNARSWSIRLLGSEDPMLCVDEHLRIFSAQGLRRMLAGAGAGVDHVEVMGFGYLLPEEAASGLGRLLSGRPPALIPWLGSHVTRLARHPSFSLGLEVFAPVGRPVV